MPPPSLPPHSELTPLLNTHSNTKFATSHKMCPLKNLLSKRSTRNLRSIRNLRDPALSPYPPNNFPFEPLISEGETNPNDAICEALEAVGLAFGSSSEPKDKPKREPKFGSKRTKRDTERVLQIPILLPPSLPPLFVHSINPYSTLGPNPTTTSIKKSTQRTTSSWVNPKNIGSRKCYGGNRSRRGGII